MRKSFTLTVVIVLVIALGTIIMGSTRLAAPWLVAESGAEAGFDFLSSLLEEDSFGRKIRSLKSFKT